MKPLLIGVTAGAVAASLGALSIVASEHANPATLPPAPAAVTTPSDLQIVRRPGNDVGRYQVVNGTPQYAKNIMLLDTVTGESWISCEGDRGATLWCKIPLSNGPGVYAKP